MTGKNTAAAAIASLMLGCLMPFPVATFAEQLRIAFASCADQARPQPLWDDILEQRPDRFLFVGDAVYADTEDLDEFRRAYQDLAAVPGFRALRQQVPVLATWDDHDFGDDDAGRDYPLREQSQRLFAEFHRLPPESPVHRRPGVYDVHYVEHGGRRVQILLLDTRYFRSPIDRAMLPSVECPFRRYLPDPDAVMLGETQWQWLAERLREPADVRLLVTSTQLIPDRHCWEKWANAPTERARLLKLIGESRAGGLVVLSGDRHMAEISRLEHPDLAYPLFEITSSGLNYAFPSAAEANRHRITEDNYREDNFGMVVIDWQPQPMIRLQIHGHGGSLPIETSIAPGDLQPSPGDR